MIDRGQLLHWALSDCVSKHSAFYKIFQREASPKIEYWETV